MPLTISSDDKSVEWDFCPIFAPLGATMSQKSSLPQAAVSVSQVLMADTGSLSSRVLEIGVASESDFRSWHFSDLANESSVGPLCGVKQTFPDYVFDFRV
jgi:hypothetical protein